MSGHDDIVYLRDNGQNRALDVGFNRLSQQHRESSLQGESSKSSERGSRHSKETDEDSTSATRRISGEKQRHLSSKRHRLRRSGGFLLDTLLGNEPLREERSGDKNGKRPVQPNGNPHRRVTSSGTSEELFLGSSPLSREISTTDGDGERPAQTSRPTSVDPAQLVQMALTLSESRKRHMSGPLQIPLLSPKDNRRVSKGEGDEFQDPSGIQRRSHVQEGFSPMPPTPRPPGPWNSEAKQQDAQDRDDAASYLPHYFSPATLSRAEKARKYFELASEYRRLLEHLPPLKPDAEAPENYIYHSTSSPGSAHSQLIRLPSYAGNKHRLGRAYNPLQALRNRRLRARERRLLPAPPESWQATEKISRWVDEVQEATRDPGYRSLPDRVRLPSYPGELDSFLDVQEPSKGHRRTDTSNTTIIRPENGWSIEPPELFADAYWTEKGNNKEFLENRFGSPIFSHSNRLSVEPQRRSQDLDRMATESEKKDGSNGDLTYQKPPSRLHLLKRPRTRLTRSPSTTSAESDGGRKPPALRYGNDAGGDENVGPLSRHMQEMIAKEERGELHSPEPESSGSNLWESQQSQFPALSNHQRPRNKVLPNEHGSFSVHTAFRHRRAKSADGRVGNRRYALSSLEDLPSAEPVSPIADNPMPSMSMDLSTPPWDGHTLSHNKSKLSRLPVFRSYSKDSDNIGHTDFAFNDESRPGSDPKSSIDSTRPSFITRHKTTESMSGSVRRQTTRAPGNGSSKGSSTNLGRFLKGGRIGELVRGEGSRLGGRFRSKDNLEETAVGSDGSAFSDESDGESGGAITPVILADDGTSTRSSSERERRRPKYTLQKLPSFKSHQGRNNAVALDDGPIREQQQGRRDFVRPSRFDRLAPPRINLPNDDSHSSDTEKPGPFGRSNRFIEADLHRTSAISIELPKESRRSGQLSTTGLSQQSGQSGRHWSISDRALPIHVQRVTLRDINRAKALILASGIKAKEILRRADMPREKQLAVIQQIADFVGQDFGEVPIKKEHIVASQLLSDKLREVLAQFEITIDRFERGPARDLGSQLEDLHQKASDHLTKLVHETSDEADAFVVELTTKQPQDVKRVDDAINDLLRQRRRQFRLLRHFGFKLLEWTVLGILWGVWFVVVIINIFRRVFIALLRFFKWLFWF
ncbi:hypothetical protein M433DRAFT_155917 [Acidomyces richmondensis BFW]|nr:MAG: hypothetical protein FE78DRAFT_92666 [Acidomyces sp. 'richmondensis']KYG44157.1 hypothetical protein M433DRAFT_155917 [Acidomyces richmondensis BFW]